MVAFWHSFCWMSHVNTYKPYQFLVPHVYLDLRSKRTPWTHRYSPSLFQWISHGEVRNHLEQLQGLQQKCIHWTKSLPQESLEEYLSGPVCWIPFCWCLNPCRPYVWSHRTRTNNRHSTGIWLFNRELNPIPSGKPTPTTWENHDLSFVLNCKTSNFQSYLSFPQGISHYSITIPNIPSSIFPGNFHGHPYYLIIIPHYP